MSQSLFKLQIDKKIYSSNNIGCDNLKAKDSKLTKNHSVVEMLQKRENTPVRMNCVHENFKEKQFSPRRKKK